MPLRPRSSARTHIGHVRRSNEDNCYADDDTGLYVIADGIGGRPRGAHASAIAVQAVIDAVRSLRAAGSPIDEPAMRAAFDLAHSAVARGNVDVSPAQGMGTTLAVAVVTADAFIVGNVGDSRVYLGSPDAASTSVVQVTHDHTLLNEAGWRDAGSTIIPKNVLTQAVGLGRSVDPYIVEGSLVARDVMILCSDGVSDYISDAAFFGISMALSQRPDRMANTLIRTALDNGGGDNCTCICVAMSARR